MNEKIVNATLNHLGMNVSDGAISFPFYKDLLGYLGYEIVRESESSLGLRSGSTDIWLRETPAMNRQNGYHRRNTGLNHIAFGVPSRDDVDRFHEFFLNRET